MGIRIPIGVEEGRRHRIEPVVLRRGLDGSLDDGDQFLQMHGDQIEQHCLLVRIIMVEQRLGDTTPLGNHRDGCTDIPEFSKKTRCILQDQVLLDGVILCSRSGHCYQSFQSCARHHNNHCPVGRSINCICQIEVQMQNICGTRLKSHAPSLGSL